MIATMILTKNHEALLNLVLPLCLDEESYSDEFTTFIVELLDNFDYEAAYAAGAKLEAVCKGDLLLSKQATAIKEAAMRLVLWTQIKTGAAVDVKAVARKSGIEEPKAKECICQLIQKAGMTFEEKDGQF